MLDATGRESTRRSDESRGRRFSEQSPPKRLVMLVSGSAMNALAHLHDALFTASERSVRVMTARGAVPGSPADEAGISAEDRILSVNGERIRNEYDLLDCISVSPGPELRFGQSSIDSDFERHGSTKKPRVENGASRAVIMALSYLFSSLKRLSSSLRRLFSASALVALS